MKFIFATLFLSLFCVLSVFAQNEIEEEDQILIYVIENPPVFEGGMSNFYKIVSKNLRSVDDKVGRVFVQFVVDTTGKTSEFKVLKGLSNKSDAEVLRLMKWMSENYSWKPRLVSGQKVKTKQCLPIIFGENNIIKVQNNEKLKIIVTEDIPIKKDLFTEQDTSEIVMSDCFKGVQIEYIEIERDTNNQEYLIYNVVENPPVFEGGMDNFYKIIQKNLELAEKPKEIGSIVLIEFVIDTTGKMTDFKILKSSFSEKNNEGFLQLLDSINSTYTWKPAMHKGKKVFYRMKLPIRICLLD